MGSRLAGVVAELGRVASGKFVLRELEIPEHTGLSAFVFEPIHGSACAVRLTDTGVSIYFEALGAKWEADSVDEIDPDMSGMVPFAAHLAWANSVARAVALFGVVRVRRRWHLFGAYTCLLRTAEDITAWANRSDHKIVRRWTPW